MNCFSSLFDDSLHFPSVFTYGFIQLFYNVINWIKIINQSLVTWPIVMWFIFYIGGEIDYWFSNRLWWFILITGIVCSNMNNDMVGGFSKRRFKIFLCPKKRFYFTLNLQHYSFLIFSMNLSLLSYCHISILKVITYSFYVFILLVYTSDRMSLNYFLPLLLLQSMLFH